jgi:tetratricopeptide (TPR) repeat protein
MPKLTRPGEIPEVDLFRPVVTAPGLDPFAELSEPLLASEALGGELAGGRFADKSKLAKALRGDPKTVAGVIGEALDRVADARRTSAHFDNPRPARLLVAVDQAERLFAEAPKDADAFGSLLQAFAGSVAYVIMVMRADAYARFQISAPLLALRVSGATFDLIPPTTAELEDMINRPIGACQPPLAFGPSDPPLSQRLVEDAKGGDALPLLQMTLEGLYLAQEARGDSVRWPEDYKGMASAVTETANAAIKPLGTGPDALEALVAGVVADVAPDPVTAEPLPVVVALDREAFVKGKPARAALIEAFVEARLLTLEGRGRVRPTHDALLRIWLEAAKLVKQMAALIRARHALVPLARAWAEAAPADKPKHLEISAPLLASGQALEKRFGEELREPLRPFIAEAEKAEEAERAREKRRNRMTIAASVGVAIATALLAAWAFSQKNAAVIAKDEAFDQRAKAEDTLMLATEAANQLVFDVVQKYRNVAGVPLSLMKTILDRTRDLQAKLLAGGQSSPRLLRSAASAQLEASDVLRTSLGDPRGALEAAQKAARFLEALLKQEPNSRDYQRELGVAYEKIGDAEVEQGHFDEAYDSFKACLAIREQLVKSDQGNDDRLRDLSVTYDKIADVEVLREHLDQALDSYKASFAIAERLAKSHPSNDELQRDLSASYENIGDIQAKRRLFEQALESYRQDFAVTKRLADTHPDNADWQSDLSNVYAKLAAVYESQGNSAKAVEALEAGRAIMAKLADRSPDNADWTKSLVELNRKLDVLKPLAPGRSRTGQHRAE